MFKFLDLEFFLDNSPELHENRSLFSKALGITHQFLDKSLKITGIAYLMCFRVSFLTKTQFSSDFALFPNFFSSMQILGFCLNSSPLSSQVIPLLNITELFAKNHKNDESNETSILLGLSLINARRFLQAAEVLRKASMYFSERKMGKSAKIQLLVAEAIKGPSMINEKMQAYYQATQLFIGKNRKKAKKYSFMTISSSK